MRQTLILALSTSLLIFSCGKKNNDSTDKNKTDHSSGNAVPAEAYKLRLNDKDIAFTNIVFTAHTFSEKAGDGSDNYVTYKANNYYEVTFSNADADVTSCYGYTSGNGTHYRLRLVAPNKVGKWKLQRYGSGCYSDYSEYTYDEGSSTSTYADIGDIALDITSVTDTEFKGNISNAGSKYAKSNSGSFVALKCSTYGDTDSYPERAKTPDCAPLE